MAKKRKTLVAVYIDGRFIGFHDNPEELFKILVKMRREGKLPNVVNFYYREPTREFYVNTSRGRVRRPYIIVEDGKPKLTPEILKKIQIGQLKWEHLVKMGIIEYLDAEEEENAYIAKRPEEVTKKHTHLEIHPAMIFGAVAGLLPFPEYNSSPRLTMASSMLKQTLGLFASNYNHRYDTKNYVLYYPQEPIAQTLTYNVLDLKRRAAGQNFVVAVLSYRGWNMSDAVIINKAAVDRGLARAVMFKTYEAEEISYPAGYKDSIEVPSSKASGYRGEEYYRNLDVDGVVIPETEVKEKDVIIGRVSPPRFLEELSVFGVVEEKLRDNSIVVKEGDAGKVDSVVVAEAATGNKIVKVRLRINKVPEIGDKFCSRHGQKGVIGMLLPPEDMPFTKDGIIPDLIINPHAIPSRMTAGHLLEMLGCKAAVMKGYKVDATPFRGDKLEKFVKELKELGFEEWGEEELYDGISGKKMKVKIFVGIIYYERLHHLVSNKMHARARGPVQLLTLQPTEGRSREGGLRFGEMERDTLLGFGVASIIRDRLFEQSDKSSQYVCRECGSIAYYDYKRDVPICSLCGSSNVAEVEMPYAFKLLLEEIRSMTIFPRLIVGKKAESL